MNKTATKVVYIEVNNKKVPIGVALVECDIDMYNYFQDINFIKIKELTHIEKEIIDLR